MPEIQPNTPEAREKARKIRNAFGLIVVANLVLVAFVMWPRPSKTPTGPDGAKPTPLPAAAQAALREMEAIGDAALAAYNAADREKFLREFSPTAVPPANAGYFDRIVAGIYRPEFGEVTAKKLIDTETNADPDFGMLVYEAQCKKRPKAKLSVNFRRESGALKIVQWRMERM